MINSKTCLKSRDSDEVVRRFTTLKTPKASKVQPECINRLEPSQHASQDRTNGPARTGDQAERAWAGSDCWVPTGLAPPRQTKATAARRLAAAQTDVEASRPVGEARTREPQTGRGGATPGGVARGRPAAQGRGAPPAPRAHQTQRSGSVTRPALGGYSGSVSRPLTFPGGFAPCVPGRNQPRAPPSVRSGPRPGGPGFARVTISGSSA